MDTQTMVYEHVPTDSAASGPSAIPELLAPAGTLDAFKAALAGGADAIYCGLGSFNARRNAENLTLETFEEACRLAHLAGTRVYVTMNILVRDDELAHALAQVRDCHIAGADGFIFQDWGLLRLVRELWPHIECHLSTQANVHDPNGVDFAVEHGCSRVTLSRELSLEEIRSCAGRGAELEVFGHGALCVCYSGECLLSSMQRGRSANRGLCRQPCRLPYRMLDAKGRDVARVDGTRLLSPRDYCTIDDLEDLTEAGIGALKVEGRMKAPDYVLTVSSAYREALDAVARHDGTRATPEVMRALARAFNRNFTDCYLKGFKDNTMMSYERGNNRGQLAGRLAAVRGKTYVLEIDEPVGEGDLLEIRNPEKFDDYVTVPAPRACDAHAMLDVRLPRRMDVGCPVRVIRSESAMAAARDVASRQWPRKRRIDVRVTARLGEPFTVELSCVPWGVHPMFMDNRMSAKVEGFVVEPARTRAVTAEEIAEHVCRFGTSPFEPARVSVEADDGIGMPFSAVHAVRARCVDLLEEELLAPWRGRDDDTIPAPSSFRVPNRQLPVQDPIVCALVSSPAAAIQAVGAGASAILAYGQDIVTGPESSGLRVAGVEPSAFEARIWPDGVVPVLPEVARTVDFEELNPLLDVKGELVCGNIGWLKAASMKGTAELWLWNTVPLHNHAAFDAMRAAGVKGVWLSPELELLEIRQLAHAAGMCLGIGVLGHIRTMTCEHCLLQSMGECAHRCSTCARRTLDLTVRDEFDRPSIVTSDAHGRSRLWQHELYDATPQIPELLDMGVSRFLVDGSLMRPDEVGKAVRRARGALDAAIGGRPALTRLRGATSGHLFERIG